MQDRALSPTPHNYYLWMIRPLTHVLSWGLFCTLMFTVKAIAVETEPLNLPELPPPVLPPNSTPPRPLPTPNPTPAPRPTPQATPLPIPIPVHPAPPAEQPRPAIASAIQGYYTLINNVQYEQGWQQLSPTLRRNTKVHPRGFNSYIGWWTKVDRVAIQATQVLAQSSTAATARANLVYFMASGRRVPERVQYRLVWDSTLKQWLIDSARRI